MDAKILIDRRSAVIENHKKLEADKTSGFNVYSPGAEKLKIAEQPLSKRPVAIKSNNTVYVVAEDVPVILGKLKEYVDSFDELSDDSIGVLEKRTLMAVQEVINDSKDQIKVDAQTWNYCANALGTVGLLVVTTGVK